MHIRTESATSWAGKSSHHRAVSLLACTEPVGPVADAAPESSRQFEAGAEAAAFTGGEDDVAAVLAGNRAAYGETEADAAGLGVARASMR